MRVRHSSVDREHLGWRFVAAFIAAAAIAWGVAAMTAMADVPVRQAPRGLVHRGAKIDFLRIWERGAEPPLGCEWVGDGDDFADLVLDCSGAAPITARELVCAQGARYRRTLGLLYGIKCEPGDPNHGLIRGVDAVALYVLQFCETCKEAD